MVNLFFSYSHKDEKYRDEFDNHLVMLKRSEIINSWYDREITAGSDLDDEIKQHLEESQIILLLVSSYFLSSDYCYDKEMKYALQRHERKEAVVIPIIVRPCDWLHSEFAHLRATPTDGKAVSSYSDIHEAFMIIVKDIRNVVKKITHRTQTRSSDEIPASVQSNNNVYHEPLLTSSGLDDYPFQEECFDYIYGYFFDKVTKLNNQDLIYAARLKKVDSEKFNVILYKNKEQYNQCSITNSNSSPFIGIGYTNQISSFTQSWNEVFTVSRNQNFIGLTPTFSFMTSLKKGIYTKEEIAKYLWDQLTRNQIQLF